MTSTSMKSIRIPLALCAILMFGSCVTPEQDNYKIEGLELNAGARWAANPETTQGIQNMQSLLADFSDTENVHAYNNLQVLLNEEFNGIFRNCTMTGPAHDQLHNFLVPIKGIFKDLTSSDLETCQAAFYDLQIHLKAYSDYFE